MKIIAEVIKIFPMQEFGDKDKPFKKQTVVFEELQEVERPNQIAIDFQQEKIIFSDDLKIGDIVTVFFSTVVNETDKGGVFNSIRGWKLVAHNPQEISHEIRKSEQKPKDDPDLPF